MTPTLVYPVALADFSDRLEGLSWSQLRLEVKNTVFLLDFSVLELYTSVGVSGMN